MSDNIEPISDQGRESIDRGVCPVCHEGLALCECDGPERERLVLSLHRDSNHQCRERVKEIEKRLAAEAEVARLTANLAECFRLSGADPDGNEDWRLAPSAVAEVKRLREDYDAAGDEVARLTKDAESLAEDHQIMTPEQAGGLSNWMVRILAERRRVIRERDEAERMKANLWNILGRRTVDCDRLAAALREVESEGLKANGAACASIANRALAEIEPKGTTNG